MVVRKRHLTGSDLQELVGSDIAARFQQSVGQVGDVDSNAGHLCRRRLGRLLYEVALSVSLRRPRQHRRATVDWRPQRLRLHLGVMEDDAGHATAVAAKEALPRRRSDNLHCYLAHAESFQVLSTQQHRPV